MKSRNLVININNKEDIDNFYKKLRYYILFKKKHILKLNIGNNINNYFKEELKEIERLFNIKDKNKKIHEVYLSICNYIDKFYIDKNICGFKDGTCMCQRMGIEKTKKNGCCGSCKYLGNKGCTIKSLACKIFYCRYIRNNYKIFKPNDIKVYKYFFSWKQKIIANVNFFKTEDENCNLLVKNSLLAYTFSKDADVDRFKEVD